MRQSEGVPRPSLEVTREGNPRETGGGAFPWAGTPGKTGEPATTGASPLEIRGVSPLPECSLSALSYSAPPPPPTPPEGRVSRPRDTHVNAQPECGDGGRLAQGEQQQEQGRGQLHQVEEVVVCEEVGRQRFGVLGVGEELVVILAFLKEQELRRCVGPREAGRLGRKTGLGRAVGGERGGPVAGGWSFRPERMDN